MGGRFHLKIAAHCHHHVAMPLSGRLGPDKIEETFQFVVQIVALKNQIYPIPH
jgi:hypothetical protein